MSEYTCPNCDASGMEVFEFIANEMVKESESRGYSAEVSESYFGYVPNEKEDT